VATARGYSRSAPEARRLPRPSAPYEHRTRWTKAGHWNQERIREALLDWEAQFRRPPLSYEWATGAAELAGLAPTDAMRRWQAEHPRWPSRTTVLRHFGAWSEALEDAGLPVRRLRFDVPLEERVLAAQRLAALGLNQTAIANEIGVSRSAVATYLRAGSCDRCGAVIVQSSTGLCRKCAHPRSSWTPEEILEAVRRWTDQEGQAPTRDHWRPGNERWRREFPAWPTATIVVWAFGRWNAALEAAGYEPRGRSWSKNETLEAIKHWARAHEDTPPSYGDWITAEEHHPSATTVAKYFGSWTTGLLAAGLAPHHPRWTQQTVVAALREWAAANGGRPPSASARRGECLPSYTTVVRLFGSWEAAIRAADMQPRQRRWTTPEIIDALLRHIAEHGRPPTQAEWTPTPPDCPSPKVVSARLGSWQRAMALATTEEDAHQTAPEEVSVQCPGRAAGSGSKS